MKAAVLHARNVLTIEQLPIPDLNEDEILVRVKVSGICGSDLPRVMGDAAHYYPIVLGHEFSGIVEKIGSQVLTIKVGDRVSGAPLIPCHECDDCSQGHYALCRHYSFIGSRIQGSWAEFVKMPERNALKIGAEVSFEQAALFEPSTVALHALRHIRYEGGEDVAIVGAGNIGMLTMQWARIMGAKSVTIFDIDDHRLEIARRLGADYTMNTRDEGLLEKCLAMTNGKGFGVVMETAGSNITMNLCFEIAANKARICFVGTPSHEVTFSSTCFELMNRKEFTLTGSWMSYSAPFPGKEWELTAHFFGNGTLRYEDMIHARFPLERMAEAFGLYSEPGRVKGKILIVNE